jgi:hypothetical protein
MIKYIEMDAIVDTKNSGDKEYIRLSNLLKNLENENSSTLCYKIAQKIVLKQVMFSNDWCSGGETCVCCCKIRDDINTNYLCLLCYDGIERLIISIENKMTNYAFLIANLPVIADIRANILKIMLYMILDD